MQMANQNFRFYNIILILAIQIQGLSFAITLTVENRLKSLGKHSLGVSQVLGGASARVYPTVQAHLLQDVNVVVQLKGVVKVEYVL